MHHIREAGLYRTLQSADCGRLNLCRYACACICVHAQQCTCWGQVGSNLPGLIILVLMLKLKMTKERKTNYRVVSEDCWVNFTQENGILGEKPIEEEGLYLLFCSTAGDQQALMHAGQMLQ